MAKQVKIAYSNVGKGDFVEVTALGTFPNGYTTKIEDWQFDQWVAFNPEAAKTHVEGDLITFPAPPVEVEKTEAQMSGELERSIIEAQEARSPEQAAKDEREGVLQLLRGERDKMALVDGKEVQLVKSAPKPKADTSGQEGSK